MNPPDRRSFAKTLAAGACASLSPSHVLGANDRVRVGIIGCGGMGRGLWKTFLGQSDVTPVAVCDVYDPFRERARQMCKEKVASYKDFRRMLDRNDIDAVIVATPDHWHALLTISACRAGKDVYVEKPLSLTIREGRVMLDTARKYQRVVQVGAQQRSGEHYKAAIDLIRNGALGAVHKISATWTRNMNPGFAPTELRSGLTHELDWEMWLGPAPYVPFDAFRFAYNWRWFWDYSGGQMTNWGAHSLDITRWALDAIAPTAVAAFGGRYELKDGGQTPDVQEAIYSFPECVVSWSGREINGVEAIRALPPFKTQGHRPLLEVHGTKGNMILTRERFDVTPEAWTGSGYDGKTPVVEPLSATGSNLGSNHARNFLDCVKSRKRPNADVEEGHRTAVMCHLGNIAMKVGRTLRWDAVKEEITGDSEANQLLSRPYRKPWMLES
jgi:predicted dehydrogenase